MSNDFHVVGIEIISQIKLNITSAYFPPSTNFNQNNLENIFSTNLPLLVPGDFNSYHRIWGAATNSQKGTILLEFLNESNLILRNDGTPTHLNTQETLSHIDLSFCSPALYSHIIWKTEKIFLEVTISLLYYILNKEMIFIS